MTADRLPDGESGWTWSGFSDFQLSWQLTIAVASRVGERGNAQAERAVVSDSEIELAFSQIYCVDFRFTVIPSKFNLEIV